MDDLHDLLDRCRSGDELAWEGLVRRLQGRVYGLATHYLRDRDEARDVAQEAFVRLYRALPTLEARGSIEGWLLSATRNLCIDLLRRRRARPPVSDVRSDEGVEIPCEDKKPDAAFEAGRRRALLYRAIDRLSPVNREIVVLREIHGMSLDQVASALDVPVGTVKSRSFRARVELARHVLAMDPGYGRAAS